MRHYRNEQALRQLFNRECEKIILAELPQLRGKFQQYGIWDSLNYYFLWNKTIDAASSAIIARMKKELGQEEQK